MDTHFPLAFDIGSHSIRFGFCHDRIPSSDIPAVLGEMVNGSESVVHTNRIGENSKYKVGTNTLCVPREGMELTNIMDEGLIQNWDAFENLMEYAYSSCLFTDPKFHSIIFTESPMNTDRNREKLMELLFEKFNVPAMMLCKNSAAVAFSCGVQSGIIVDSGATHTTAVPVYQGYVMTRALVSSSMGGDFILNKCEQHLSKNNIDVIPHYLIANKQPVNAKEIPIWSRKNTVPNVTSSWHNYMCKSVVEDFKHTVLEVADRGAILSNLPTCHYEFPNGYNQEFGSERFKIPEFLFNTNESRDLTSLSGIVHRCAEMCNSKILDDLYANIIITGGNSLIKGFPRRLHSEIAGNFRNIFRVKLTAPIDSSIMRFGAWIGGALLATTPKLNHLWCSRNDYHANGANYGNCLLEHMLISGGFPTNTRIGIEFSIDTDIQKLMNCFCIAEKFLDNITTLKEGFIIQKIDQQLLPDGIMKELCTNQEYHPFLFAQHQKLPSKTYESFNEAVDEFYSNLESQKYDVKCMQQEKGAVKKLQNIVKDHEERLKKLQDTQDEHKFKAELITNNLDLVDNTIQFVRQAVAKQLHWDEIWDMIRQLNFEDDGCTYAIVKNLKLSVNHITLQLFDPYNEENQNEENCQLIDIDLGQSAFGNAERYYGSKKQSAIKEKKTIDSSSTVLKMAEKKTKQTLKDMQVVASINKVRKTYWFEKFYWFISSENYLVIAGRDAHQNEVIVKRYMKSSDVYVHAGFSGATTVIIKNPINQPVPPATLNEAAVMAISYSVSWAMKINLQNAFWVKPEQVSKTAPTGEYLTTGSFMIRGKKNYLPATHLILGLSFLFKLEDSSISRHANERKVKGIEHEGLDNIEENNDEFENIPSENDSDEDLEKNTETQNKETLYAVNDDGDSLEVKTNNKHSEDEEEEKEEELRSNNNETLKNVIGATSIPNCNDTCKSVEQSEAVSSDSDDDDIELDDVNDLDKKNESNKPQILKRGQRGKLKRIKEKYKDQDEDEREMRIKLLQSSMNEDKKLKRAKKKDKKNKKSTDKNKAAGNKKIFIKSLPMLLEAPNDTIQFEVQKEPMKKSEDNENSEDDETDKPTDLTETHMLDSLTGVPYAEDELLFAVPVVAPYTALTNYKYKLKLTPGNTKRGKASKTCLNLFLKDKTSTTREKNLMRSVNVQDIARNIPNGVKLSAPSLSKVLNK